MPTLLAIDPATERAVSDTGWACATFDATQPFTLVDSGVTHGGFEGFCANFDFDRLRETDIVVCEKYIPYNNFGDPKPLLIEGVVRYLRPTVVLQPSSILSKNGLVGPNTLKALGLYSTTGHHNDINSAVAHALCYVITLPHKPTLEMLR